MALITFTSDFGISDHYVAQTKAKILQSFSEAQIIDIAHNAKAFNLAQLSFSVMSVFRDFPEGTVHLIGGDEKKDSYLAAHLERHFFVCPDNGILSLISDKTPEQVVMLAAEHSATKAAAHLAQEKTIADLGEATAEYKQLMRRKSRATKKEISGHVIHVDHYGNLISNIEKTDFDILSRNRNYTLSFSRERLNAVQAHINEVEPGDAFAVFTSTGYLMIGINQGNGNQLLGLEYDSPVHIQFEE